MAIAPALDGHVEIPHDWNPRVHQRRLWRFMMRGGTAKKRAAAVWHRRAGKDDTVMNFIARESFNRKGTYWHMLPAATQARQVVWDSINIRGQRRIDQAFPHAIRRGKAREQDMRIALANGSIYQCVGSDNFARLLGANPVGVVFSEWQRANPQAWDYIRPVLRENGGWAIFIYTPYGRNHGKRTFDNFSRLMAEEGGQGTHFAEKLSILDTGLLDETDMDQERAEGYSEEMIQQEYYCSFTAPTEGSFYAKELAKLEEKGFIGDYPFIPSLPVHTCWDIGKGDPTAIWFFQLIPFSPVLHFIDFYTNTGEGLSHYARVLQEKAHELGYVYGEHIAPHDMGHDGEWTVDEDRLTRARNYGIKFTVNPRVKRKDETIERVRVTLPLCRINRHACQHGLDALWSYSKRWNEKLQEWSDEELKDWASHPADAFGEGCKRIAWLRMMGREPDTGGRRGPGDWMGS